MANIEEDTRQKAATAWREVRPLELEPHSIEIISEKRKSTVYRLVWATHTGSTVIAKRCMHWGMRVERTIYEGVAGFLPMDMAAYYGCVEENNGDWYWLFMEDIGNIRPSLSKYQDSALAARWLASLHGATASESAKSKLPYSGPVHPCSSLGPDRKQLPERGIAYYAWTMQVSYELLLSFRSNHGVLVRKQVEDALPLYDIVERCWPVLERLCGEAPRVIAHGDFVEKNLCLRKGREDVLIAVDWESAGWSTPAIDLAVFYERNFDPILAEYCAAVRRNWSGVSVELIRKLISVGVLCRALAALYWEAHMVPYSAPQAVENMSIYSRQLSAALALLEFPPKSGR